MSAPTIIAFCAPVDRDRIIEALFGRSFFFAEDPIDLRGDSLILLAVGPEGGAALARWVAERGLDGVAGVALVGVTAPWAERRERTCEACMIDGAPCNTPSHWDDRSYLPLGPLEPLRAVAKRARTQTALPPRHAKTAGPSSAAWVAQERPATPLRFVIACAPDEGGCAWCNGRAIVSINALWGGGGRRDVICHACTNGRALSSSDVARELISDADGQFGAHGDPLESYEWVSGGAIVICYERRAALDEHGLRAVVERLVRLEREAELKRAS